jgi:precorrin-2 dehydrogenase/sirohydrochlorin ferrochelatase
VFDLTGKTCLVTGGGKVAGRKAAGLLEAGARVLLVSPAVTPGLASLAAAGRLRWEERTYRTGDQDGAVLVFAATGDARVNRQVAEDCRRLGVPVNVADAPDLCDFFLPAAVRRGRLTVAVSTAGASPALAARIRDRLAGLLPAGWGPFLDFLAERRERVRQAVPEPEKRRDILERMASREIWDLLEQGDFTGAKERVDLVYRGSGG